MAPPNQRFRRIGFNLTGGPGGAKDLRYDFVVRPSDLTRAETSRMSVNQTLGGAWVDSFGPGLGTITLAGTTGWRGGFFASGEELFAQLREVVFKDWHKRRLDSVVAGQDPSAVKLYFVDTLDEISALVVPKQFTLRRSKTQPLLSSYQITLIEIGDGTASDDVDKIIAALSNPLRFLLGLTGLGGTLSTIANYAQQGMAVLGAARAGFQALMDLPNTLLGPFISMARQAGGMLDGALAMFHSTLLDVSEAGRNATAALAADDTLSPLERFPLMQAAAAWNDINCTLANSFQTGRYFRSYDDLFGASGCSSTGGGDAASRYTAGGLNPWDAVFPQEVAPVAVSAEAAAAIVTLKGDPLDLIGDQARIGGLLSVMAGGITTP